jgi:spore coat polysaccharide biosynthesis protein SpsF
MNRRIAIIQARMTSTRLPGKCLLPLAGQPMLTHVINRVRLIPGIDGVWIATTNDGSEAPLVALARSIGTPVYRGSADDVLSRFAAIAHDTRADVIMRITADCPLIDPHLSGRVLQLFESARTTCDYASNTLRRTFPRGLDTEVFSNRVLQELNLEATDPLDREHVTRFIYTNPDRYNILDLVGPADYSRLRWTVDTPEDFQFVSKVYDCLSARQLGNAFEHTMSVLEEFPELSHINAHVEQKDAI